MDAILPAAGSAERMSGIPKFLLPVTDDYKSLLENHIEKLSQICEKIYLSTKPELVPIIKSLKIDKKNLFILEVKTKTMSETVLKTISDSNSENFILIMPDTYFLNGDPYTKLNKEPNIAELACWKIRDSQRGKLGEVQFDDDGNVLKIIDKKPDNGFEYAWGALTFSKKLIPYIDKDDPHIGYAIKNALEKKETIETIKINGNYYDCGTPAEYVELLEKVLLNK